MSSASLGSAGSLAWLARFRSGALGASHSGETPAELETRLAFLANPLAQSPPRVEASEVRPIVIVGAGSIIQDGHGPAYRLAGFPLLAIYDLERAQAEQRQRAFAIGHVCASLEEAVARGVADGAIFDVAVPPEHILPTLAALPPGSAVLIQKPLGKNMNQARQIVELCRERHLLAAINFQLPLSPQVFTAFHALALGAIGELHEAAVCLDVRTEWSRWPFVLAEPRIEILLHSIHYLSLFAFFVGSPAAIASRQWGDPEHPTLRERDVASDTTLYYRRPGARELRCRIRANHLSTKPRAEWRCELVLSGSEGRVRALIGDVIDYPDGVDDELWIESARHGSWRVPLKGNRFPHAFVATMSELQRTAASARRGTPLAPLNDLRFAERVMAMAETCYRSHEQGAVELAFSDPG